MLSETYKQILKITVPLILSSLSTQIMQIIDRFLAAHISTQSMNALSISGSYVSVITIFLSTITSITSVFTARLNGQANFKQISSYTWQMLHFSILVFAASIPFYFYPDIICFLPEQYKNIGLGYQKILTLFIFIPTAYGALSGFFIGLGKTGIITTSVIVSNLLNVILDIVFMFGFKDIVPAQGVTGAAIATVIANCVGFSMLVYAFLSKYNRLKYNTSKTQFEFKRFIECIKLGSPLALDRIFNLGLWSAVFVLLGKTSNDLATIESITVSLIILFSCCSDALNRGTATVVSNLIGLKKLSEVKSSVNKFRHLNIVFGLIRSIPLFLYNKILFLILGKINGNILYLNSELSFVFKAVLFIVFFDGIVKIFEGVFAAGGKTIFPAILNSILLFLLVGCQTFYMYTKGTLDSIYEINYGSIAVSLISAIILSIRYYQKKWNRIIID